VKSRAPSLPEVNFSDQGDVRYLHLGTEWVQGSMKIDAPFEIELEYVQRMMAWLLFADGKTVASRHAMQLGLGAATLTKFSRKILRMRTTAVELNPQVVSACRGWFKLPPDDERLQVRLQIAPEVLPVGLPFLCLQPLVENAVRHGLSRKPGVGMVSIEARDAGAECHITVEDDGVGMDPSVFALDNSDNEDGEHVGLVNVDERLRSVFGDHHGLVVETAPGAGTKVSMRVPKFHPQVRA
jgi:light-regulated signal transduction histidine kinase (bacteriophytochrome)